MNEAGLMAASFQIKAENMAAAHTAAKHIVIKAQKQRKGFAWVDMNELAAATSLQEILRAWGWELGIDTQGAASGIDGPAGDKVGDEKALFDAIAPFVEDGSYIQMIYDADNTIWRWVFRDGRCIEVEADLVFSTP
ncbi:MAG: hypothetical protein R6V19_10555 [Armatimonadota bacterium]